MPKAVYINSYQNKANYQKVAQAVLDSPEVVARYRAISEKFDLPFEEVLADGIGHFLSQMDTDETFRLAMACGRRLT